MATLEERDAVNRWRMLKIEKRARLRARLLKLRETIEDYRDMGGNVRLRFHTGDPLDFMEALGTEEITLDLIGIEVED